MAQTLYKIQISQHRNTQLRNQPCWNMLLDLPLQIFQTIQFHTNLPHNFCGWFPNDFACQLCPWPLVTCDIIQLFVHNGGMFWQFCGRNTGNQHLFQNMNIRFFSVFTINRHLINDIMKQNSDWIIFHSGFKTLCWNKSTSYWPQYYLLTDWYSLHEKIQPDVA